MKYQPQTIAVNGVRLQFVTAGQGPLVLLCHGWPELGHSWRHQLPAIAAAGFRAVAPDMRGFGGSEAPPDPDAYSILHLVGDMVALVTALGETQATIVGHDWGAAVAWHAAMLRPDVFRTVVAMSVPFRPRGRLPPLETLKQAGLGDYYWHYFQRPGIAEAELERDIAATFRRILFTGSGDAPANSASMMHVAPGAGFLDRTSDPAALPPWLEPSDLEVVVDAYRRSGFRGGLNWYRNIDRNWSLLAPWQGATIRQPALFIAGSRDVVLQGKLGEAAIAQLPGVVPGLERTLLIEGAGHWIQRERPAEVNAAVIEFLREHA